MGYTRVKQLSAGHNSVDYHENAPGAPGKGGSPGKQSAAHIITGARAAAGAGASARSARAALGEGGASESGPPTLSLPLSIKPVCYGNI